MISIRKSEFSIILHYWWSKPYKHSNSPAPQRIPYHYGRIPFSKSSYICRNSSPFFYPALSPNNGGGKMFLIILKIVATPNLHLLQLLASFAFSPTFQLCSITATSQVFIGLPLFLVPFTLKSNALLRKLFLSIPFSYHCPYQRTLMALAS